MINMKRQSPTCGADPGDVTLELIASSNDVWNDANVDLHESKTENQIACMGDNLAEARHRGITTELTIALSRRIHIKENGRKPRYIDLSKQP
jgi:hypothetical protein